MKIGVLGTQGTILSGAYPRAVSQLSTRLDVVGQAAPLLVPLVEEGWLDGQVPELCVRRYLEPLFAQGAGVIVLGCTHYPLLAPVIARVAEELAGHAVPIVDSALATARDVTRLMQEGRLSPAGPSGSETPRLEVLVTDRPRSFAEVASRFLGERAPEVAQIDLG